MTWLHLSVPTLLVAAVWASYRASVCFGSAGMRYATARDVSQRAFRRGQAYRALTLFLAAAGGLVWGRLL